MIFEIHCTGIHQTKGLTAAQLTITYRNEVKEYYPGLWNSLLY